ncbi:MAG: FHA domain-containing protein, partial [Bacteroidales bacterium]
MTNKETNKNTKKSVLVPYLILKSLNGVHSNITILNEKLIIGRLTDVNDVALQPDPQCLVTRYCHCYIEIRNCTGWLIDNASKNGTFLKRNNLMQKVSGEIKLQDNDCIMILGEINKNKELNYWQLTFIDPLATKDIAFGQTTIFYDWSQAILIINRDGKQEIITSLTPLEHKFLRYMDQKNKQNNNVPVVCTYEELIS